MIKIQLLLLIMLASVVQASEIKYQEKVLISDARTKCEIIFHQMAIVAMYCPNNTKLGEMIEDFKAIEQVTNWPMPVFEVFNDRKKAPDSLVKYNSLPDKVPFQTYSIQIKNGQILYKECFKNAKRIDCKF